MTCYQLLIEISNEVEELFSVFNTEEQMFNAAKAFVEETLFVDTEGVETMQDLHNLLENELSGNWQMRWKEQKLDVKVGILEDDGILQDVVANVPGINFVFLRESEGNDDAHETCFIYEKDFKDPDRRFILRNFEIPHNPLAAELLFKSANECGLIRFDSDPDIGKEMAYLNHWEEAGETYWAFYGCMYADFQFGKDPEEMVIVVSETESKEIANSLGHYRPGNIFYDEPNLRAFTAAEYLLEKRTGAND